MRGDYDSLRKQLIKQHKFVIIKYKIIIIEEVNHRKRHHLAIATLLQPYY